MLGPELARDLWAALKGPSKAQTLDDRVQVCKQRPVSFHLHLIPDLQRPTAIRPDLAEIPSMTPSGHSHSRGRLIPQVDRGVVRARTISPWQPPPPAHPSVARYPVDSVPLVSAIPKGQGQRGERRGRCCLKVLNSNPRTTRSHALQEPVSMKGMPTRRKAQ